MGTVTRAEGIGVETIKIRAGVKFPGRHHAAPKKKGRKPESLRPFWFRSLESEDYHCNRRPKRTERLRALPFVEVIRPNWPLVTPVWGPPRWGELVTL